MLRWCIRIPVGLLGFAAIYFLAVLILGWVPVNSDYRQADEGVEIRVAFNGLHTNFVVPVKTSAMDWGSFAPLEGERSNWWRYLYVGWGDHDFYVETPRAEDFSLATTLKAIFLPTRAVMHVKYYSFLPVPDDTHIKLILTAAEYQRLVTYIKNSFRLDDAGKSILIKGKDYGLDDAFYHANGTYHLFDTCNNWANTALKRTGVKTAVWSPFGYAILDHVKNR